MSEHPADLTAHPFVQEFSPQVQRRLAECVDGTVLWEPGRTVFREGGVAERCYLVMRGCVSIEVHSPGLAPRIVQTLHDGDVLGWSWLFPPYRWSFDARALAETEAIVLDGVKLRSCIAEHPDLGYEVLYEFARLVARRLNVTRLQLLDLYADRS